MSTPQQPQGDPNQPYIPQGYELSKKKKPFYQRLGCIIPIAIIAIIIVVIAVSSGGGDDAADTDGSATSNGESADNGAETEAGPAVLGETVSMEKADVTASNLRPVTDALGSYLCADVAFTVTSEDESLNLNGLMDWKLTDPNGVTITQAPGGETDYNSVEVGPGGNTSGTVCFDAAGEPGEYTLTFEEGLSFSSDQAVWAAQL